MSHKQKTLWTKDFTSITIATILTAVGGEAMNLPISLLVFDETGSTFLSALVLICGVLPDVVLSVLAAPLIDKGGKKKMDCRTRYPDSGVVCDDGTLYQCSCVQLSAVSDICSCGRNDFGVLPSCI